MSLQGKVAIVTGASRGIGRQIAIQLAQAGALIAVNYASNSDKADEVVRTIEQAGGQATALQADVSQVSEIERLFSLTIERYGRLDILVNNAGIMECLPIADMTEASFDRQLKSDELIESFRRMNAFGRLGEPDDIADVIELLVSDKARWITGQTIRINGGFN